MKINNDCKIISLILLICLSGSAPAVTVELNIHHKHKADIQLWLNGSANARQKQLLKRVENSINQHFENELSAAAIFDDPDFINDGMRISVKDVRVFQDTLNFIDFRYTRSFYKEKYSLKLLLNSRIFQSRFFESLKSKDLDENLLNQIFENEKALRFFCTFPGSCTQTNMQKVDGKYTYDMNLREFNKAGGVIIFRSSQFFSEIYWAVFGILIILICLIARFTLKG